MTKAQRRRAHERINAIPAVEVDRAVRTAFPGTDDATRKVLAKALINAAHRLVSPRPRTDYGRRPDGAI